MSKISHKTRCLIEAEAMLWVVHEAMSIREYSGEFADEISRIQKQVAELAERMRRSNDQFEE